MSICVWWLQSKGFFDNKLPQKSNNILGPKGSKVDGMALKNISCSKTIADMQHSWDCGQYGLKYNAADSGIQPCTAETRSHHRFSSGFYFWLMSLPEHCIVACCILRCILVVAHNFENESTMKDLP